MFLVHWLLKIGKEKNNSQYDWSVLLRFLKIISLQLLKFKPSCVRLLVTLNGKCGDAKTLHDPFNHAVVVGTFMHTSRSFWTSALQLPVLVVLRVTVASRQLLPDDISEVWISRPPMWLSAVYQLYRSVPLFKADCYCEFVNGGVKVNVKAIQQKLPVCCS